MQENTDDNRNEVKVSDEQGTNNPSRGLFIMSTPTEVNGVQLFGITKVEAFALISIIHAKMCKEFALD